MQIGSKILSGPAGGPFTSGSGQVQAQTKGGLETFMSKYGGIL